MVQIPFETASCIVSFLDEFATFSRYKLQCLIFISKQSIFSLSMNSYDVVFCCYSECSSRFSRKRFYSLCLYRFICYLFCKWSYNFFTLVFFYFSLLCFLGISVNSSVSFSFLLLNLMSVRSMQFLMLASPLQHSFNILLRDIVFRMQ